MPEGIKKLRWKRESNPCARFCRPLPHHSAIPPWRYRLTQYSAGADDETRTRDPHLGKVMRYQLRYIRIAPRTLYRCGARRNIIVLRASFQIPSPAAFFLAPIFHIRAIPKHTGVILPRQWTAGHLPLMRTPAQPIRCLNLVRCRFSHRKVL